MGSRSPGRTQGNGGCGTFDAARTSHATRAAYSRLQVLRHAGRGGVGLLILSHTCSETLLETRTSLPPISALILTPLTQRFGTRSAADPGRIRVVGISGPAPQGLDCAAYSCEYARGSKQVRQVDFLRVLGQLRKRLSSVEGCSHYIRIEPWVVCQFEPHNRDGTH